MKNVVIPVPAFAGINLRAGIQTFNPFVVSPSNHERTSHTHSNCSVEQVGLGPRLRGDDNKRAQR